MGLLNFGNEQKLIQNEFKRFALTEIESIAAELDKTCAFPTSIINRLSDLGLSSLIVPEKYGGAGFDATSLCIAIEEISKICASIGTILVVNNCLVAYPIIKYGQEAQKDLYLKKLATGEIGAFITDLEIDLLDKKLAAKFTSGSYSITGKRDFVLNGEAASFFVLPISSSNGKAFYLIDKGNASIIKITKPEILGMRAAGIVGLEFKETQLTKESCLIPEDKGEKVRQEISEYSNIGFSAIALGIAQASFEAALKYSKERKQFSRPICEFPMVQEMLVDMKVKIEMARLLVYDAANKFDNGQDYSLAAKIAQLHGGEAAVFSGLKAIQIHGGYGYIKDYPVERYLRDAKVLQVLEKTPHDLKSKIAKELLS